MAVSSRTQHGHGRRDLLDKVLHALNHPVRRRILTALMSKRGSAKTLSIEFDMPLGVVSYHLNQVLDGECEVVDRIEKVRRRGAWEHVYVIKAEAFERVLPWSQIPHPIKGRLRRFSLDEFLTALATSAANGSIDALEDSRLEWAPAEVDHHGWHEICDAAEQFRAAIDLAKARSRKRRPRSESPDDLLNVIVGLAAFEASSQ